MQIKMQLAIFPFRYVPWHRLPNKNPQKRTKRNQNNLVSFVLMCKCFISYVFFTVVLVQISSAIIILSGGGDEQFLHILIYQQLGPNCTQSKGGGDEHFCQPGECVSTILGSLGSSVVACWQQFVTLQSLRLPDSCKLHVQLIGRQLAVSLESREIGISIRCQSGAFCKVLQQVVILAR